jgi:hypothetical protein
MIRAKRERAVIGAAEMFAIEARDLGKLGEEEVVADLEAEAPEGGLEDGDGGALCEVHFLFVGAEVRQEPLAVDADLAVRRADGGRVVDRAALRGGALGEAEHDRRLVPPRGPRRGLDGGAVCGLCKLDHAVAHGVAREPHLGEEREVGLSLGDKVEHALEVDGGAASLGTPLGAEDAQGLRLGALQTPRRC